jgi:hypothetical protein
MCKVRVDFITNQAPHYRAALWKRLIENDFLDMLFDDEIYWVYLDACCTNGFRCERKFGSLSRISCEMRRRAYVRTVTKIGSWSEMLSVEKSGDRI